MIKTGISIGVIVAVGAAVWFALASGAQNKTPVANGSGATSTESWECNGDAKICPDGSSVGRTGPKCEFIACPSPDATSAILTTYLGGNATGLNVTVSPREIVSDSRCPADVQCIWAGTVEVRAALATQVAHGEHVFVLGKPHTFGDFFVTLKEVTPAPIAGEEIPESSYRFVFEVKRK